MKFLPSPSFSLLFPLSSLSFSFLFFFPLFGKQKNRKKYPIHWFTPHITPESQDSATQLCLSRGLRQPNTWTITHCILECTGAVLEFTSSHSNITCRCVKWHHNHCTKCSCLGSCNLHRGMSAEASGEQTSEMFFKRCEYICNFINGKPSSSIGKVSYTWQKMKSSYSWSNSVPCNRKGSIGKVSYKWQKKEKPE